MKNFASRPLHSVLNLFRNVTSRNPNYNSTFLRLADAAPCKASQISLYHNYQRLIGQKMPLPRLNDTGFRVFSQNDEDGIILFIFSVIEPTNKIFVEIGTGDGRECNCANLAVNFGWHGLFIDGNEAAIERGVTLYNSLADTRVYPPSFLSAVVNRSNINEVLADSGFTGDIDFLSIDIDGMDYWLWEAIDCINPRLVAVEINGKFGLRSITVPYKENWWYDSKRYPHYHGASITAFNNLAKKKDYRLIGANRLGFNAFYLRNDICPELLPEVSAESCRTHYVRSFDDEFFAQISHLDYVEI